MPALIRGIYKSVRSEHAFATLA